MGKIHHGQHAEDQRQTNRQQGVHRPEGDARHQLQHEQGRGDVKHGAFSFSRQALWPSSVQLRKLASLGFSIPTTLKTSFLSFMPLDCDSTMMTD